MSSIGLGIVTGATGHADKVDTGLLCLRLELLRQPLGQLQGRAQSV